MIASVQVYPTFFEHLSQAGPLFVLLALLLAASTVFGGFRLRRQNLSPTAVALLVWVPTFAGCVLAGLQSLAAEICVRSNEQGLAYWSHPERYIGHIRIYLGLGVLCSILLLLLHRISAPKSQAP